MKLIKSEDDKPDIQMAPLIDCVFLLLIFFLVATTLKKHEPELPVDLPYSGVSVMATREDNLLIIGLDSYGNRYLGAEMVTTELLHRHLRERAANNADQKVRIDADRQARYEDLVEIIELCQFEGLHNIAFHTRKDIKLRP